MLLSRTNTGLDDLQPTPVREYLDAFYNAKYFAKRLRKTEGTEIDFRNILRELKEKASVNFFLPSSSSLTAGLNNWGKRLAFFVSTYKNYKAEVAKYPSEK